MTPIRLGLIGAGVIGQRHMLAIEKYSAITVAGIADPSVSGEEVAHKNAIPVFKDAESLMGAMSLDGVIIATPTEHHHQPVITALNAGLPVLVEKPMVATLAEAAEVTELSSKVNKPVLVGHHRRYYGCTTKARELVQGGAIGSLVCVSGQWNMRKHDSYYAPNWRKRWQAGPVLTNLIHDMDLLRFICGDIESLTAEISSAIQGFEKEDAAALVLRFKNGALGTFILSDQCASPWSWELGTGENAAFPPSGQNAFRFMGTEGALEFPNLRLWKQSDSGSADTPD